MQSAATRGFTVVTVVTLVFHADRGMESIGSTT